MQSIRVIYISRYQFQDKVTGQMVRSGRVQYSSPTPVDDSDQRGYPALTCPCDYDLISKFREVPGDYQVEFTTKPDSKGRPQLSISAVAPIQKAG